MKKTVIHLLCHSLIDDKDLNYYMFGGFGPRQIKGVRPYTREFNYEVWYAVVGLKKSKVIKKDGIIYRAFPAWTLNKTLESFLPLVSSSELFAKLETMDPRHTLIHFQGERGTLLYYLLLKYPQFPVVLQYHGYGQPPSWDWLERIFITPLEKIAFPRIKHFFVPIKPRRNYLTNLIKIPRKNISTENIGIDFGLFKPMSKKESRKKLGIPQNSYTILYIGHLMSSKGADKIFLAYHSLKKKYNNLYLLVVGALEDDPLYKKLKNKADRIEHFVSNKEMPLYITSSDVLCFYGNAKNIRFAGPGIAPTEALACNVNVISTNLHHFNDRIIKKIGLRPKSYEDFVAKLEFLINHPAHQFNARTIVEPYVSFQMISQSIKRVYRACLTYKNDNL